MDRNDLLEFGREIADADARIRIAFNEDDKTADFQSEAAHFLKANEQRVGRDLELYGFMGEKIMGWEYVLTMILEEVLIPIKKDFPLAYRVGSNRLIGWGKSVYPDRFEKWKELF